MAKQDKAAEKKAPIDPPVMLKGLIEVAQRDITLMLEAGYLFIELKRHKEAEEIFVGVSALLPSSEVPHLALGNLYFAQGRFSQAFKSHEQAIALNARSATAHASAAEALFFLKRFDDAQAMLDKARALEPEGPAHAFADALAEAHQLGVFA